MKRRRSLLALIVVCAVGGTTAFFPWWGSAAGHRSAGEISADTLSALGRWLGVAHTVGTPAASSDGESSEAAGNFVVVRRVARPTCAEALVPRGSSTLARLLYGVEPGTCADVGYARSTGYARVRAPGIGMLHVSLFEEASDA